MNPSARTLPFLLDSSVLVKWYNREEEDSALALDLREGHLRGSWEIRFADISFYELANALHFSRVSPNKVVENIQSLLALELQIYSFDLLVVRSALNLCARKKIPIYDAYLVALAKRENLIFVTADDKLLRKFLTDDSVIALQKFPTETNGD